MNEWKAGIRRHRRRWFGLILPLPVVPIAAQAGGENYDVAVGFALALCFYLALMFYVIPGLVASDRRHPATGMIWAITLRFAAARTSERLEHTLQLSGGAIKTLARIHIFDLNNSGAPLTHGIDGMHAEPAVGDEP